MHKLSLLIVIVLSGILAMPAFAQNVFSASQAAAEKNLPNTVMSTQDYSSTVTRLQTLTKNTLTNQITTPYQPGASAAASTAAPAAAPVQQAPASSVNQYSSSEPQSVSAPASSAIPTETPTGSSTSSPQPAPSRPYTGFGGSQSNTQTAPQTGGGKSSGGGWDFNY